MTLDPATATAAYIDSLGPEALAKAANYTAGGHWLLLWGLAISALVTWAVLRSGVLDSLASRLANRGWALRTWLICAAFLLTNAIVTLPWSIYTEWVRETNYGRTSQPLGDFLGQNAIGIVLSTLLGALFFLGIYALIKRSGQIGRAHV